MSLTLSYKICNSRVFHLRRCLFNSVLPRTFQGNNRAVGLSGLSPRKDAVRSS